MKRAFVVLSVLVGVSQPVFGPPVLGLVYGMSLETLVERSDFIAVGSLSDVLEFSKWRTDYSRGIITVEKVLWGKVKPGEKLVLAWRNRTGEKVWRLEHEKWQNTTAIWLLTFDQKGYVRADWPSRARDVKDQKQILKILSGMPGKEVKEFVAVAPPQELLSAGKPFVSLTTFVLIITAVVGAVGYLVLSRIGPEKRRLALQALGVLVAIPILFLVAYWHFRIYAWIAFSGKMLPRAFFVAIMLVLLYTTIGLACLMAYRERK